MYIKNVKNIVNVKYIQSAGLVVLSLGAGFGGSWIFKVVDSGKNHSISQATQTQIVSSESDLNATVVKNVSPSVVSINVTSQNTYSDWFFGSGTTGSESAGTGIIISEDGYIVTNKHVIPTNARSVNVTLSDGTVYENVEVIGRDPRTSVDIAFLKIKDAKGLTPAKLGDSSSVRVGEKVIAIGNALGQFQNTVTTGVISGIGRPITAGDGMNSENLTNLFQTDSAINPGNSGGPLVNVNSEVIGINTAVAGNAQNIGFAIPINDVKGTLAGVLKKGKLEVPYLGVRYVDLTEELAKQLDLEQTKGAYIYASANQRAIVQGSPAEKAGLKKGDIITKINDITLDKNNGLSNTVSKYAVGEGVTLKVIRDGKEQTIIVTLEAAPVQ